MSLKSLQDGFIEIFKQNNIPLQIDFSGDENQKDLSLIMIIDDIERPFSTEKVYKIKVAFDGQSYITFDKSKARIYELFSKVDDLLNNLTKNDLSIATNNSIIGLYRETQATSSDEETHSFNIAINIVLENFNL